MLITQLAYSNSFYHLFPFGGQAEKRIREEKARVGMTPAKQLRADLWSDQWCSLTATSKFQLLPLSPHRLRVILQLGIEWFAQRQSSSSFDIGRSWWILLMRHPGKTCPRRNFEVENYLHESTMEKIQAPGLGHSSNSFLPFLQTSSFKPAKAWS